VLNPHPHFFPHFSFFCFVFYPFFLEPFFIGSVFLVFSFRWWGKFPIFTPQTPPPSGGGGLVLFFFVFFAPHLGFFFFSFPSPVLHKTHTLVLENKKGGVVGVFSLAGHFFFFFFPPARGWFCCLGVCNPLSFFSDTPLLTPTNPPPGWWRGHPHPQQFF